MRRQTVSEICQSDSEKLIPPSEIARKAYSSEDVGSFRFCSVVRNAASIWRSIGQEKVEKANTDTNKLGRSLRSRRSSPLLAMDR